MKKRLRPFTKGRVLVKVITYVKGKKRIRWREFMRSRFMSLKYKKKLIPTGKKAKSPKTSKMVGIYDTEAEKWLRITYGISGWMGGRKIPYGIITIMIIWFYKGKEHQEPFLADFFPTKYNVNDKKELHSFMESCYLGVNDLLESFIAQQFMKDFNIKTISIRYSHALQLFEVRDATNAELDAFPLDKTMTRLERLIKTKGRAFHDIASFDVDSYEKGKYIDFICKLDQINDLKVNKKYKVSL